MNKTLILVPAVIGTFITIIGYYLSIMHWPGGHNLLLTGGILVLVSVMLIFVNLFKKGD
ncbi:hypothetical protein ACLI1A_05225 [Flavobacterium sp. RHBU_3]|uniref:hypothetical protein n=1 Tax=Flavobacterium sp. RHBU_3 TaxID=3391184 RepID=UPI00398493E2